MTRRRGVATQGKDSPGFRPLILLICIQRYCGDRFSHRQSIMKVEPQPSEREVLAGLVERVTYQNADNGFCVVRVKARGHRDLVTLVGHAATISAGEWITATGGWVNDRTHGQQFKARFLRTEKYLSSGCSGSGTGLRQAVAGCFRRQGLRRDRG